MPLGGLQPLISGRTKKARCASARLGRGLVKECWIGRALLAAVIAAECAQVCLTVWFNYWNALFFDALQNKDLPAFWQQLMTFTVIAAAFIVVAVYQLYLNQWLQIRWRRWMTHRYLDHWLNDGVHYRMRLSGDAADNPDQRIADDITMFVDQTLTLGVGLLSAVTTLASFSVILWGISSQIPLSIAGYSFAVPGFSGVDRACLLTRGNGRRTPDRPRADRSQLQQAALWS